MRLPERTPEGLRKLHSLTGMIPLGAFLLEHIAVNATALGGPAAFRGAVEAIDRLPFLPALEIGLIAVPLVLHSVLGVLIATELGADGRPDWPDRRIAIQRVTGVLLLPYLIYHVWATRLSPDAARPGADLIAIMAKQVRDPGGILFHAVGVTLVAWHFGNGLQGFALRWGLARTAGAERTAARLGLAVSLVLATAGVASLLAFRRASPVAELAR